MNTREQLARLMDTRILVTDGAMGTMIQGYRLDEAVDAVEHQIDQAVLSGMTQFGVIHGTGEGVLQRGVRELLRSHQHVLDYEFARPEDGGYGKTIVKLK